MRSARSRVESKWFARSVDRHVPRSGPLLHSLVVVAQLTEVYFFFLFSRVCAHRIRYPDMAFGHAYIHERDGS